MSNTVPELKPGELINVAIKGARVDDVLAEDVSLFAGTYRFDLVLNAPGVTVERVASAEWPPQAGDVWEDRLGSKWFAFRDSHGCVLMQPSDPTVSLSLSPEEVLDNVGPLTLAYRDGWTPAPEAAADEPAEVDRRAGYIAGYRLLADLLTEHPELSLDWHGAALFNRDSREDVDQWATALGVAAVDADRTDGREYYVAKTKLAGLEVKAYFLGEESASVLGDDVDDPADTGPVTDCTCKDCAEVLEEQTAAADAEILLAAETPAAVDEPEHRAEAGWGGGVGEKYGNRCTCGTTFDGFDSQAEAQYELTRHIANEAKPWVIA